MKSSSRSSFRLAYFLVEHIKKVELLVHQMVMTLLRQELGFAGVAPTDVGVVVGRTPPSIDNPDRRSASFAHS